MPRRAAPNQNVHRWRHPVEPKAEPRQGRPAMRREKRRCSRVPVAPISPHGHPPTHELSSRATFSVLRYSCNHVRLSQRRPNPARNPKTCTPCHSAADGRSARSIAGRDRSITGTHHLWDARWINGIGLAGGALLVSDPKDRTRGHESRLLAVSSLNGQVCGAAQHHQSQRAVGRVRDDQQVRGGA